MAYGAAKQGSIQGTGSICSAVLCLPSLPSLTILNRANACAVLGRSAAHVRALLVGLSACCRPIMHFRCTKLFTPIVCRCRHHGVCLGGCPALLAATVLHPHAAPSPRDACCMAGGVSLPDATQQQVTGHQRRGCPVQRSSFSRW